MNFKCLNTSLNHYYCRKEEDRETELKKVICRALFSVQLAKNLRPTRRRPCSHQATENGNFK
jgi:hypothetical protein